MYQSETQKIRPEILPYLATSEKVLDYGCGSDKIAPWATGVDIRPLPGVDIVTQDLRHIESVIRPEDGLWGAIYSSHFLEHVEDDVAMVKAWIELLKVGGILALYLPDDELYDNDTNPEHLHRYRYISFIEEFLPQFPQLKLKNGGYHFGDDLYSFWVVAEKI